MKKLIFISIISFLLSCSTKKADYFDAEYQSVFKLAAKQDKMIFIDFYTVWCGPCKFFDKNIKYDSNFKSYMTDHFYTLQIDAELEQNKEIVTKYNPTGYPTFVITNSKGEEIDRIFGLKEKLPEKFIDLIGSILQGNEELELLKGQYIQNPDSTELFRKIILDKLLARNLYRAVMDISDFAILKSKDSSLIQEAKFFKAYASIKNPKTQSTKLMVDYVYETKNEQMLEYGCTELFYHYRSKNITDSIKICLNKLIAFKSGNHLSYVRDYAKFLYEQDIDIEYANSLTKEYSEFPGNETDHWTPFLNGHKYAKQGQLEKGIGDFDNWMIKYSEPANFEDDYWHYKFYIDLIIHYKAASLKAIQYAEKFENNNPNIDNKQQLAELYYLNGQISNAIDKIKEIQTMIDDPKKKEEYNNLINKYSDSQ
jgi:thioredoxin-related protein